MAIFIFLTVIQAIVAAALVGVILMQRSEGGGLGVGGSSNSFMSARGTADFLTRATGVLAATFVALSIVLAILAVGSNGTGRKIDTSLDRTVPQSAPARPVDPLAPAAQPGTTTGNAAGGAAPAPLPSAPAGNDPLSGSAAR